MALVTAIGFALVIFLTAMVVLNQTYRRFQLSAHRTDHAIGQSAAEAGLQYAFARLDKDGVFRTSVQNKRLALGAGPIDPNDPRAEYVITCHPSGFTPDATVLPLHMGNPSPSGKHVTVRIRYLLAVDSPPDPSRPYKVRAQSTFGTALP